MYKYKYYNHKSHIIHDVNLYTFEKIHETLLFIRLRVYIILLIWKSGRLRKKRSCSA